MQIKSLKLINFKRFKDFSITPEGGSLDIYGANGEGKTTIYDAFLWLLTGKDSLNRADHDIKPTGATAPIVEVEGVFDIGGAEVRFKRVYSEDWTKKRNAAHKTLTGHTTDYHLNDMGVAVGKRKYDDAVAEIVDLKTLRLLTDSTHFMTRLKREEQREIIMTLAGGDISDEVVIASKEELKGLPDIKGDRTIAAHKTFVKDKQVKINEALTGIPTRIDEKKRGMPDVSDLDHNKLEGIVATLRVKRSKKEAEKVRIEEGGEVATKNEELAKINTTIIELKNEQGETNSEILAGKRKSLEQLSNNLTTVKNDLNAATTAIETKQGEIETLETDMAKLREDFAEEGKKVFEYAEYAPAETDDTCPACLQSLPASDVENAKAKALADYNIKRSTANEKFDKEKTEVLAKIDTDGKAKREKVVSLKSVIAETGKEIERCEAGVKELTAQIKSLKTEIEQLTEQDTAVAEDPKMTAALEEKANIETVIKGLKEDSASAIEAVEAEITSIDSGIKTAETDLKKFSDRTKGEARIEELKAEEDKLNIEHEQLEKEFYLCELFNRAKAELVEGRINDKFKVARFELFREQMNGGIEEICNVTYLGKPGSNSEKVNIGVDIINVLGAHYGIQPVLFLDNRESTTELINTDAQVINLYVSSEDRKLRIEPALEKVKEAV